MPTKAELKAGANYKTSYESKEGERVEAKFYSKEANDNFAKGMEFMGVKDIIKSYYNKHVNTWYRYHHDDIP